VTNVRILLLLGISGEVLLDLLDPFKQNRGSQAVGEVRLYRRTLVRFCACLGWRSPGSKTLSGSEELL